MNNINLKFNEVSACPSDINEHIETLYNYSKECTSVMELGVRGCISSWAFVRGLLDNNNTTKKFFMNDIVNCDIDHLLNSTKDLPIEVKYEWISDLDLVVNENYDLVFIDTWHIYGQLIRELNKFSKITNKYIIMHDTETYKINSEEGCGKTIEERMEQTGFTREEIVNGLQLAVDEFLEKNNEWKIKEVFTNNNGLTILQKK
jgi:hypothetical protein